MAKGSIQGRLRVVAGHVDKDTGYEFGNLNERDLAAEFLKLAKFKGERTGPIIEIHYGWSESSNRNGYEAWTSHDITTDELLWLRNLMIELQAFVGMQNRGVQFCRSCPHNLKLDRADDGALRVMLKLGFLTNAMDRSRYMVNKAKIAAFLSTATATHGGSTHTPIESVGSQDRETGPEAGQTPEPEEEISTPPPPESPTAES